MSASVSLATSVSPRWRALLDERAAEAVSLLCAIPGVRGVIVGGSLGRDEPWPLSDIDVLPVYERPSETAAAAVAECQSALVDWWAASGRAQTLDLGWLAFTAEELRAALAGGPALVAERVAADTRWLHGLDKAYGGRSGLADDGLIGEFTAFATAVRFDPVVVAARREHWRGEARRLAAEARSAAEDPAGATALLRETARALRLVRVESWGERLGSMGREWTRFEAMAERHGQRQQAERLARLAGADPADAVRRGQLAPLWLRERIDLALAARRAVGEPIDEARNARDQLAAFAVHVTRHRPDLHGAWTGSPDPALSEHLDEIEELVTELA
ncbi:nucleotidyltransferase domain-containing protein [Streptomyces sp. NBRC 109706]|uniref:nucleotidyltransferase domain-containing protein n=1 Tax=Streptomyces sp. NBRC 109706 TaxID=1550035 RepID=UPI0007850E8C|nr:nucleotidyltransferase domain-containing protein [Streptomyces sp. NBRC 109706]